MWHSEQDDRKDTDESSDELNIGVYRIPGGGEDDDGDGKTVICYTWSSCCPGCHVAEVCPDGSPFVSEMRCRRAEAIDDVGPHFILNISSGARDQAPIFINRDDSWDGRDKMIFASTRPGSCGTNNLNLWISEELLDADAFAWAEPHPLVEHNALGLPSLCNEVNTTTPEAGPALGLATSATSVRLIYASSVVRAGQSKGRNDLWECELELLPQGFICKVPRNLARHNSSCNDYRPAVSADLKRMIFVSDRSPGGCGENFNDLWIAESDVALGFLDVDSRNLVELNSPDHREGGPAFYAETYDLLYNVGPPAPSDRDVYFSRWR